MQTQAYQIRIGSENMQPQQVQHWLNQHSYWAQGIPLETVRSMIENSCCIGAFHEDLQVGFARLVTDYATFAYLADVYVEEAHRGHGLSRAMLDALLGEPFVRQLRRLMLATLDAHELYTHYGFRKVAAPERLMEITKPNCYTSNLS